MKYIIYTACFLVLTGMFGCTKETQAPEEEKPLTKKEMLTKAGWKLNAATYQSNQMTEPKDSYSTLASCNKDDITYYLPDKTYILTQGVNKCPNIYPQVLNTNTWELSGDEKYVHMGTFQTYELVTLTDSSLTIKTHNEPVVQILSYVHL